MALIVKKTRNRKKTYKSKRRDFKIRSRGKSKHRKRSHVTTTRVIKRKTRRNLKGGVDSPTVDSPTYQRLISSRGIDIIPNTYLQGDCTKTKADTNGNFNCNEKYILDINKNIIRRCHNKKNFIGSIVGCNNTPYNPLNKIIHNFTMQNEITINKNNLTVENLQLTEQEVISDRFSLPFNDKFSSVILIKNNLDEEEAGMGEGLPHRYIIITPDNTTVYNGNTRALDIEQFNSNLTRDKIGSFLDAKTSNLIIRYFTQLGS